MKIKVTNISKDFSFGIMMFVFIFNFGQIRAQYSVTLDDRNDYAQLINKYFQKNEWEKGKNILDEGLQKYPKDSDLRMLSGKYYLGKKNYDLARYELLESLKQNKNNVGAKQILVNVEIESRRYSSAICYINELLEVNPYWKELWLKKIEVYRLQGNHVEANRMLKRLSQIYPEDVKLKSTYLYYLEEEALNKSNRGDIEKAIELGNKLIGEDPNNESYYLQLINNNIKSGNYEQALANAERGLYNIPNSTELIYKKVDILSSMSRYAEAISFLQKNENHIGKKNFVQSETNIGSESKYTYQLEQAASYYRKSDPYNLYKMLYAKKPRNKDAFSYIFANAISKGFYEDALDAIKTAKKVHGDNKDLLNKERYVYATMGVQSKADQLTMELYDRYPEDTDIKYEYSLYKTRLAKSFMQEGLYNKAAEHWRFVVDNGDAEQRENALISLYNCLYESDKYDEAIDVLVKLIEIYPEEPDWRGKLAVVYGKQKKYMEALNEYEQVIRLSNSSDHLRALIGYDELATICVKELNEEYRFDEALYLIDKWLSVYPKSEAATRYAINISAQMSDFGNMKKYVSHGLENKPDNIFYKIKLSEITDHDKEYRKSIAILSPALKTNPYHKELIGAYSESSQNYALELIRQLRPEYSLVIADSALIYDPKNKTLKYFKGLAYEKMHENDSAYFYQSFYEPGPLEIKEFTRHLDYLKYKTYKNQISFDYQRSRYGDIDAISTISTIEYLRLAKNNTYIGRINYAGRDEGKGLQGQIEWTHNWRKDIYTRIDAALANKIFSSFIVNGSIFKSFAKEWEAELGAGYRKMADKKSVANIVIGLAKEYDPWWLDARFNSIILNRKWYYSLSGQARFNINSPRNYIVAMGSFGSAPEVDIIDNQLYKGFDVTNSMVGLGFHHILYSNVSVGILGNWYNFEDTRESYLDKKRNLYNIYLQLHVHF